MKKLLIAGAVLASCAAIQSASAADMALKAVPPPPVVDEWTGWYVGLNLGGSFGRSSTTYTGPGFAPFTTSRSLDGVLGGGQIGYNWQFNRNWLIGLEADIQGTGQKGTAALPTFVFVPTATIAPLPTVTSTATLAQKLPWFGTVRARLGVEPTDHWLLYVTGGLAYGEIKSTAAVTASSAFAGGPVLATATVASSANTTRAGWTVGVGSEWMFAKQWSAKLEYLYMDFGTFNNAFLGTGPFYPAIATSSHVTDNVVRAGVNYHFH